MERKIMEYIHDQHIGIYKNGMSNEWCDEVIDHFESNIHRVMRRSEEDLKNNVKDHFLQLEDPQLIHEFNILFLEKFLNAYSSHFMFFPSNLDINHYQIQKTLPTEGFFPYHCEYRMDGNFWRRVGAYSVYLNDVEEGGETEFLYQLKRIKPEKGTVCIFPAGYTHIHRGNTPFSGEKYIMTGWLEMPPEYGN